MPVEQVTKGSLSPSRTQAMIMAEFSKVNRFLTERKELATTSVDKLPLPKNEKVVLKSQIGSELNVDQKGKAALGLRATLIRSQIKQAGNALTKEEKHLYEAQAEASEGIAAFLEAFASGRYSVEQAFAKKKGGFLGLFGGYKAADKFVRATLTIAEKSGNTKFALDNIKALEQLKDKVPIISAALTKNGEKIAKIKSKAEDPRTAPFQEDSEARPAYGEGASASQGLPPELTSKLPGRPGKN